MKVHADSIANNYSALTEPTTDNVLVSYCLVEIEIHITAARTSACFSCPYSV